MKQMNKAEMMRIINDTYDVRHKDNLNEDIYAAVDGVIALLDKGELRVAEKINGQWQTHEWVKKAILLSFYLNQNTSSGDGMPFTWYDKVPLKTAGWGQSDFDYAGFRSVPGSIVRRGACIGRNVILMPSFVNIGANVGDGTMIDTWATVGSCAQIGQKCHISGGAGIGGVLEPLQANPVIIEDNCFIGARSEIAEGVIVEEGAVISMGVFIGASTKIVDRATGAITYGRVPAYSVVVPGVLPCASHGSAVPLPHLACAVIIKKVDEKTRLKTGINDLLRDDI